MKKIGRSYGVIEAGSEPAIHVQVYYKGRKVINATKLEFHGTELRFENEPKTAILNWRQRIEGSVDL